MKKRWKTMDKVYLVVLGIIVFFAWMDSHQIMPFHIISTQQGWDLYNEYTGPAIWSTWWFVMGAIGLIWYIIFKDKSEALAISLSAWVLMFFGTQDILYFYFSYQELASVGCWADMLLPVRIVSDIMGEACPTATSFILSAAIGMFLSFYLYHKLREARW